MSGDGPKERRSRVDQFGNVVGGPTNKGVSRLSDTSLTSYQKDLTRQIINEGATNPQRRLALEKSAERAGLDMAAIEGR
ncbi:hypothetical protein ISR94_00735 [Candidatus Microgenomates bacterium]|nr:hypothetical protein [Candidatus Microgenomates bacterium]